MNIAFLGFVFKVDAELKFHFPVFFLGERPQTVKKSEKGAGENHRQSIMSDIHMCK